MNSAGSPNPLRQAQIYLHHRAREQIRAFLTSCQNNDGGFRGRNRASDLYYTFFGISASIAVDRHLPPASGEYLQEFIALEQLDLVHLCSLARCWAALTAAGVCRQRQPRNIIAYRMLSQCRRCL